MENVMRVPSAACVKYLGSGKMLPLGIHFFVKCALLLVNSEFICKKLLRLVKRSYVLVNMIVFKKQEHVCFS